MLKPGPGRDLGPDGEATPVRRILHLFSGPSDREDSLRAICAEHGIIVEEYDIVNGEAGNLLDDTVWHPLLKRIREGEFDLIIAGVPCETWSHARNLPGGPPVLRTKDFLHGLPDLKPKQREQVRISDVLTERTCEACDAGARVGAGFLLENPAPWEDGTASIWDYRRIKKLADDWRGEGAAFVDFDMCCYGACARKPTRMLYLRLDGDSLAARCRHPKRRWVCPGGRHYWAPHENLGGKDEQGAFRTHALRAYPVGLHLILVELIETSAAKAQA